LGIVVFVFLSLVSSHFAAFFAARAFVAPPIPPPLSTPAGVERGAWILFLHSGYASTWERSRPGLGCRHFSEPVVVNGTGSARLWLAAARQRRESGRQRGGLESGRSERPAPLAGSFLPIYYDRLSEVSARSGGGDGSFRRSLAGFQRSNQAPPSRPGGGGKGAGGIGGDYKSAARQNLSKKIKPPASTP